MHDKISRLSGEGLLPDDTTALALPEPCGEKVRVAGSTVFLCFGKELLRWRNGHGAADLDESGKVRREFGVEIGGEGADEFTLSAPSHGEKGEAQRFRSCRFDVGVKSVPR
jgi:hypothetical protein